ncbi:hypothetical protein VOLCADRAFT_93446 [Volvox carteri f. nagariensis]|uniref:GLTSCR protein conserved domain-containing protein n=1 Tax=Volvox carteri f. nagariensis TaxID=3068 RepID=D8U255_VOLCA|nr:uncharacterized protein VOLCADRAFT_93446 [Volvox carteri f. nagariensis]EFJ46222.1 hypothetical protein VOLCADRAFT_93446 [Volvox carteri f. nagariensis]|eukprot:XP_002952669.1 hypothetical protein VOLCADRAFT_93446 [Volvox carteri f. nagariensis]
MAAKPPPSKKPTTESESKAQKRSLDLLAEDCKRICTTALNKPFTTLQDAVDHLLPFHVLSSLTGDEVDAEEAEAAQDSARLLCSRRDLAAELTTRRAVELHSRVEDLRQRLGKLEDRYRTRHQRPLPEEELFIAQVLKEVAERTLETERAKPTVLSSESESDSDEVLGAVSTTGVPVGPTVKSNIKGKDCG